MTRRSTCGSISGTLPNCQRDDRRDAPRDPPICQGTTGGTLSGTPPICQGTIGGTSLISPSDRHVPGSCHGHVATLSRLIRRDCQTHSDGTGQHESTRWTATDSHLPC
jgi:hypothetical protein